MQEQKEGSTPIRVKNCTVDKLEQMAIKISSERHKLITIGQLANEILDEWITRQDEGQTK